jgi:GT2 family glycosyltransferase
MKTYYDKAKVFVVIPNKNGVAHLSYSLPALEKSTYPNYQAVLIDDHSTDESVNFVKDNYPHVKVIINKRQKGFAGAVNTGIAYALEQEGDYIAIFNNDIKVRPDWVELVIDIINRCPDIGLIGYTEIPKENESLFYTIKELKGNVEYKDVKGLPGCLYLCPASVFRHIGLFDEGYYMYGEDNDFFHRLMKAGYNIIQTNVPVWHYGEGSSGNNKFFTTWLAYRNALRFSIKNEALWQVVRMILTLFNQGCNPFLRKETCNPVLKRMRRYNILVGFMLVIAAVIWNTINIVSTLKLRYKSN